MEIQIEIHDDLFNRYKKLAEKKDLFMPELNKNIFAKAIQNWIYRNDDELDVLEKLDMFMEDYLDKTECGKI